MFQCIKKFVLSWFQISCVDRATPNTILVCTVFTKDNPTSWVLMMSGTKSEAAQYSQVKKIHVLMLGPIKHAGLRWWWLLLPETHTTLIKLQNEKFSLGKYCTSLSNLYTQSVENSKQLSQHYFKNSSWTWKLLCILLPFNKTSDKLSNERACTNSL